MEEIASIEAGIDMWKIFQSMRNNWLIDSSRSSELTPLPDDKFYNSDLRTYECRDGTFTHYTADGVIGRSLEMYGEWAQDEIDLLSEYIVDDSVILDIGANIGTHAVAFGRRISDRGTVLAFEAQPNVATLLCSNVVQNGLFDRVQCYNVLVGAEDRLQRTFLSEQNDNAGARSFFHEVRGASEHRGRPINLALVTVDSLMLSRCSILKIDVEAMEVDVIKGARETIKTHHPIIYFEHALGDGDHVSKIEKIVKPMGYEMYWHVAYPFNPRNHRGEKLNIFGGSVEINVLALPPGQSPPVHVSLIEDAWAPPPRPLPEDAVKGRPA